MNGKVIVPIKYSQIDINGIYMYAQDDRGVTVYDAKGEQASLNQDVKILNTSNEEYKIKINTSDQATKYGVINKSGKQLIEQKYNYISYLFNNYFMASYENGKLGVLNDKEEVKIELNNDSLQQIQETQLIQTTKAENKTVTLYSKDLNKICEMQNATLEVKDDFIKIASDKEVKYFDKNGKELKNTEAYPNNRLFVKVEGDKYGFVDNRGNKVVDCKYDKAYEFNEYGFAAVKIDDKWGAINEQGQEVAEPVYKFEEGVEPSFIRTIL